MEQSADIRKKLLAREQALQEAVNRLGQEARDTGEDDVQDVADRSVSDEAKAAALDITAREYHALQDVRSALSRLEDGTYGVCVVCGRAIEPARLAAIPETPYCLEHAETTPRRPTQE